MVRYIEVGGIELSILKYYENTVLVGEFSKETTVVFVVDTIDIWVEPNLTSAQSRVSVALQWDAVNALFGQQITLCCTSLDEDVGKVTLHEDVLLLLVRVRVEGYLYQFRLTIRVSREVVNLWTRRTEGYVIFLIACDRSHVEAFDIVRSRLSVTINDVINRTLIVLLKHLYVKYTLTHKYLVGNSDNLILTITVEDNHVIEVRAVLNELSLLKTRTNETFLTVNI